MKYLSKVFLVLVATFSMAWGEIATHPILLGQTLQGALTEESGTSLIHGYAKEYYQFSLEKSQNVAIILSGALTNKRLRLYDNKGKLLEEANKGFGTIAYMLKQGTYLIDISTYTGDLGEFELTIRENKIETFSIGLNEYLYGKWNSKTGLSLERNLAKVYYDFELDKEERVTFQLDEDGDSTGELKLINDKGQTVASGFRYYSGKEFYVQEIIIDLKPGQYRIEVSLIKAAKYNNRYTFYDKYYLSVHTTTKGQLWHQSTIDLNTTKHGAPFFLQVQDSEQQYYFKEYTFTLSEPKEVVISVLSEETDVYFIVEDSNGNNIDIEKNGVYEVAHGGNIFDLDAGEYTIRVMTKEKGSYSLNLRENTPSKIQPVKLNSKIHSTFTYLSEVYHKELWSLDHGYTLEYINKYSFDVVVPTEMSITTSSNETLVLFNDQQEVIKRYYGKHLEIKLEPGKYVLGVIAKNDSYMSAIDRSIDLELTVKKDYSFLIPIYGLLLQ